MLCPLSTAGSEWLVHNLRGLGVDLMVYVWEILCLHIVLQASRPHFAEHNWFSSGIQTGNMIGPRDEDDLVPEKMYLAREITAFTWRVEKMFPGQWEWLTDIRREEIEGLAKFRDKMLFLTVRSSCLQCSYCFSSTKETADWTERCRGLQRVCDQRPLVSFVNEIGWAWEEGAHQGCVWNLPRSSKPRAISKNVPNGLIPKPVATKWPSMCARLHVSREGWIWLFKGSTVPTAWRWHYCKILMRVLKGRL